MTVWVLLVQRINLFRDTIFYVVGIGFVFLNYAMNKPIPRNDSLYKKIIYREMAEGSSFRNCPQGLPCREVNARSSCHRGFPGIDLFCDTIGKCLILEGFYGILYKDV